MLHFVLLLLKISLCLVKKGSVPINEENIQVLNPGSVPPHRGRPKKQPAKEDLSVEDQSSLFSVIKTGKSSLQVCDLSFECD